MRQLCVTLKNKDQIQDRPSSFLSLRKCHQISCGTRPHYSATQKSVTCILCYAETNRILRKQTATCNGGYCCSFRKGRAGKGGGGGGERAEDVSDCSQHNIHSRNMSRCSRLFSASHRECFAAFFEQAAGDRPLHRLTRQRNI